MPEFNLYCDWEHDWSLNFMFCPFSNMLETTVTPVYWYRLPADLKIKKTSNWHSAQRENTLILRIPHVKLRSKLVHLWQGAARGWAEEPIFVGPWNVVSRRIENIYWILYFRFWISIHSELPWHQLLLLTEYILPDK